MKDFRGHKARVLGWEVSHLTVTQQAMLIVGGSIIFNLLYGCLQEYLVINVFHRRFGLLLSVMQTHLFAFCAHLQRLRLNEAHIRRIPLKWYVVLACAQSSAIALGNIGMMQLNYAAKVIFKSSKAFPMMIWGAFFLNRSYQKREYISVAVMVTGLVIFIEADVLSPAIFSVAGVILMILCVFMDCCYSNLSEVAMRRYDASAEEVIFYTYWLAGIYQLFSAVVSGELKEGAIVFWKDGSVTTIAALLIYGISGFLGASCSTALTKSFGALNSSLASATRKALNLILSFALFPKPFTFLHFCGVSLFMSGLTTQTYWQKSRTSKKSLFLPVKFNFNEEISSPKTAPPSYSSSPGDESALSTKKTLDPSFLSGIHESEIHEKLIEPLSSSKKVLRKDNHPELYPSMA